jgi:hypothetical protein
MAPAAAPPTVAAIGKRAKRDSVEASSAALGLGAGDGAGGDSGLLDTGGPSGAGLAWVPGQPPVPGVRIAHYEIIKLLGRGGMGSVYLARDLRLGRRVAIKFLRTHSADMTKRFILEARTTAAVAHENIVVIFEVDAWQGSPFMVFEYLKGKPLTKLIPENKPLPPAARRRADGAGAARARLGAQPGHRSPRPQARQHLSSPTCGITKVLDFGIAKVRPQR